MATGRRGKRARRGSGLRFTAAGTSITVLVATVLVAGVFTASRVIADESFDVAGEQYDVQLDRLDPMKRPKAAEGVKLGDPEPLEGGEKEVEPAPAKSRETCEKAGKADAMLGLEAGAEVCRSSSTTQAPDAVDAPLFEIAAGMEAAPAPEPAPAEEADEAGDPGEPTDQPTDGSTGQPTDESTDGTGDSTDKPSESAQADPSSTPNDDDSEGPAAPPTPGESGSGVKPSPSPGAGDGPVGTPSARGPPGAPGGSLVVQPAAFTGSGGVARAAAPGPGEYMAPNWVQATPAHSPSVSIYSSMVYDPVRNHVVLFGGQKSNGSYSNETWVWNGVDWAQMSPTTSPTARQRSSMVWDPVRQKVILFGGQTSVLTVANDVWSWNGTDWTQESPVGTTPVARAGAGMAYDPMREALVLFGGSASGGARNDTFQLKSVAGVWTWTQVQANGASGAPTARVDLGLAYSTSTSQLVLFGGGTGSCPSCTLYNDTWTLGAGASAWNEESPDHSPVERGAVSMVYDPGLGAVVVFGGITSGA